MRKKTRVKRSLVVVIIIIALILLVGGGLLILSKNNKIEHRKDKNIMIKLNTLEEVNSFSKDKNIKVNISYEYDDNIEKDKVISQSIKEGESIKDVTSIDVVVSLGKLDKDKLANDGINELGKVPIMMYHGIREKTANSTGTVGGNVDKDGYNRTPEAFREDLEFYYENGYEMIRLDDYINGIVKASYGKSPIILTFDDGNEDNIKVTGLDDKGNIIIDKNSAVGILEEFKKKHPDTNVTATFFVNGGIFNQSEYNDKILKWMVENGYDIGNHTQTHLDIKKSSGDRVQKEIAYVYDELEKVIPGKYVKIIALPFGSPYVKTHDNLNMFYQLVIMEKHMKQKQP